MEGKADGHVGYWPAKGLICLKISYSIFARLLSSALPAVPNVGRTFLRDGIGFEKAGWDIADAILAYRRVTTTANKASYEKTTACVTIGVFMPERISAPAVRLASVAINRLLRICFTAAANACVEKRSKVL